MLRDITGGKWVNADTEVETGCGIVPFTYKEKNYVHALQWGIGLELFLLSRDPWRLVLSTDHPNGGSFLSYPRLIRLLMDRDFRNEQLAPGEHEGDPQHRAARRPRPRVHARARSRSSRAPGRRGCSASRDKGHLGAGADADVTIYDEREDREEMFATPRYVIKGGRVVVRDGELVEALAGDLLRVDAPHDPDVEDVLRDQFEEHYTVQFENYPVREPWLLEPARQVAGEAAGVMRLHDAEVEDTFAEAFPMWGARIVVTAETPGWAEHAGRSLTGFATSVIGCKCEAGIERVLDASETPDGRPGHRRAAVRPRRGGPRQAARRAHRPDRADVPDDRVLQRPRRGGRRRRRRPAALLRRRLAGEQGARRPALLADPGDGGRVPRRRSASGSSRASAAGTSSSSPGTSRPRCGAAEAAADAMRAVEGAIMPFPGGIARSGSKVGSRYKAVIASTNHVLCPTLRAQVDDSRCRTASGRCSRS